jgi:predicted SAM-dependent methyltransferase
MTEPPSPPSGPADGSVKVNFGSAAEAIPGWINVDKSPGVLLARRPALRAALGRLGLLSDEQIWGFSPDVIYGDATRRLRFADRTVEVIYSSHMIEHLSRAAGRRFLAEARRVLRPGGRVRLATPDLGALITEYCRADPTGGGSPAADEFMAALHLFHAGDEGLLRRLISRNLSGHWHQWLYDVESLSALLAEAGFTEIRRMEFRCGEFPDLERIEARPDSLFIQAQAP